jgi:hypothetical protein
VQECAKALDLGWGALSAGLVQKAMAKAAELAAVAEGSAPTVVDVTVVVAMAVEVRHYREEEAARLLSVMHADARTSSATGSAAEARQLAGPSTDRPDVGRSMELRWFGDDEWTVVELEAYTEDGLAEVAFQDGRTEEVDLGQVEWVTVAGSEVSPAADAAVGAPPPAAGKCHYVCVVGTAPLQRHPCQKYTKQLKLGTVLHKSTGSGGFGVLKIDVGRLQGRHYWETGVISGVIPLFLVERGDHS